MTVPDSANDRTIQETDDKTIVEDRNKTIAETDKTLTEKGQHAVEATQTLATFREYRVMEQLPVSGGEADIFLVENKEEQRILKLYRFGMSPNEEILKRMKNLSDSLPGHIVRIFEYGFDEKTKRWYEIQEHARYGSIREIAEYKPNKKVINKIIEEISEGLKMLHDNNVLHLDLKPSNILIREIKPIALIFTDFGISSLLDPELSKKMTGIKGTPLYWSPEAFTGIVGRETDYWSLGMIVLELLLGRHPFSGLDTKVIMYTLSTKGVAIPDDIDDEYRKLLRGLLTREPKRRWGYAEVRKYLNGESNIPDYYSVEKDEGPRAKTAYKFHDKEFFSMAELTHAFVESEKAWEDAREHLRRGYVSRWLEKNVDYETGARVERLRETAGDDTDMVVVRVVYSFAKDLPFILCGKLVTPKNLFIYLDRTSRKEQTPGEDTLVNTLLRGRLIEYYREYLLLTGKDRDEFSPLFDAVLRVASVVSIYEEKVNSGLRVLDIALNPTAFLLPPDIIDNVRVQLDFIVENHAVIVRKSNFEALIENHILPDTFKEEIIRVLHEGNASEYIAAARLFTDRQLMQKQEYTQVANEYILPTWLTTDILAGNKSSYMAAVSLLRTLRKDGLLIRNAHLTDYIKRNPTYRTALPIKAGRSESDQKGSFEERLSQTVRSDLDRTGYLSLAKYMKNNVNAAFLPVLEKIIKEPALTADGMTVIEQYIRSLRSCNVAWDELDKKIINELYGDIFGKNRITAGERIEKATGIARKPAITAFISLIAGMKIDEETMAPEWALAGLATGVFIGILAASIIAVMKIETFFFGIMLLGVFLGVIRRSGTLGLFAALTGLVGEVFFGQGMAMEIIFIFMMCAIGGTSAGAFLGGKRRKTTIGEKLYSRYRARIDDVISERKEYT